MEQIDIQVQHCPEVDDARTFEVEFRSKCETNKNGPIKIHHVGMFAMCTNPEPVSDKVFTYEDFINMVKEICLDEDI